VRSECIEFLLILNYLCPLLIAANPLLPCRDASGENPPWMKLQLARARRVSLVFS
jgi:hypothetical protein